MQSRTVALATALLGISAIAGSRRSIAQGVPNTLSPIVATSGRGESHVVPDRGSVQIAVETRAQSAGAAAAANASATTRVLAALRAAGLTSSELSTTGFTVGTDYLRPPTATVGTQPPISFIARNGVRADIRTLDNLSKVIDAALAAGATSIGQIQFTSSRTEEIRKDALAMAVQHARTDAEAIARAAGGSLGPLVELTTLGGGPGQSYYDLAYPAVAGGTTQMRVVSSPTPLAAGDVLVAVTVIGRWRFVPGQ